MEIRHLRGFVAVAEELHFGRAAHRLRVAQPALSQQIKRLETELGVPLFRRTKRRVELSPAGRMLLGEARQILWRVENAARVARQAHSGEIGTLYVVAGPVASHVLLAPVLRAFRMRSPGVDLRLMESLMDDAVMSLQVGQADVGLMVPYFHPELLVREVVLEVPLLAALPRSHALARKDRISLAQLAGEPFVLFPAQEGAGFGARVAGICQQAGFTPTIREGTRDFRTLLMMVAAGYGVTLVPATSRSLRLAGVSGVRLEDPDATVQLCVAWLARNASPLVAPFLQTVRACSAKLSSRYDHVR